MKSPCCKIVMFYHPMSLIVNNSSLLSICQAFFEMFYFLGKGVKNMVEFTVIGVIRVRIDCILISGF